MKTGNKAILYIGYFLFLMVGMISCNSSTITDNRIDNSGDIWSITDTLKTDFEIEDTAYYHDILFTCRVTNEYKFSNIYVWYSITAPDGRISEGIKTFDVMDKSGKWLGSGFGDVHSYELPLLNNWNAGMKGKFEIRIVQNMRTDELTGVRGEGVKVNRGEDIF
ncbi:MAG: gliding motility lipoprotein GldH [Bacteroidetes bacterium]|nr:gliding motility lipoprotein GldH [Bacteroidota bacterium]